MNLSNKFFIREKINVELTYKCSLACPACPRQIQWKDLNKKIMGEDLSLNDFHKICKHFKWVELCGQLSDPLYHPQFHDILKITNQYDLDNIKVHTAVSQPSMDFYIDAFKINPNVKWVFGIDGLPKDSHNYRINQDGEKLFNIMIECSKYMKYRPTWQYIVFSYNEKDIELAKKIADENNIIIHFIESSRWDNWKKKDPKNYKPVKTLNSPSYHNNTTLDPDCFYTLPFGTDIWGHLLPCCRIDDRGNYSNNIYKELASVSKISNYDSIQDILNTPLWIEFTKNLENDIGMPACYRLCSKQSTPLVIARDSEGNEVHRG